ncbi:hypothetical protein [Streptomyces sp. Rer75]|uniref:hypothetical protein n=1 Tax=unclassified Streptomyces TaxID=2593676 RepID=UPI0015CFDE36|nr:hypothetical protein [Streptomyces sp. Rer75]QLH19268.1 hypothetical protein HYQ63_31580 [Streptomyces sp. Rer75]
MRWAPGRGRAVVALGGPGMGVAALVVITGGAARPDLGALRGGWVFAAVTAGLAALAAMALRGGGVSGAGVRRGVRVDSAAGPPVDTGSVRPH